MGAGAVVLVPIMQLKVSGHCQRDIFTQEAGSSH
jgi:hypothetical protein